MGFQGLHTMMEQPNQRLLFVCLLIWLVGWWVGGLGWVGLGWFWLWQCYCRQIKSCIHAGQVAYPWATSPAQPKGFSCHDQASDCSPLGPPLWSSTSIPSWLSFKDTDPSSSCSFSSFFDALLPSPSPTEQALSLHGCQSLCPCTAGKDLSPPSNIGSLWEAPHHRETRIKIWRCYLEAESQLILIFLPPLGSWENFCSYLSLILESQMWLLGLLPSAGCLSSFKRDDSVEWLFTKGPGVLFGLCFEPHLSGSRMDLVY